MSTCDRIREYFEKLIDWTCLEKLNLRKTVIVLMILDFVSSICLLVPTMAVEFVYGHNSGRAGFVDRKWLRHTDIYKYRRFQPWELDHPVDWDEGDRRKIKKTRDILDEKCSIYDAGSSLPGDPGDYIKEVVGHPTGSGYITTLRTVIKMWTVSITLLYFSCPLLLLALWWRAQTARLVTFYIIIQFIPLSLLVMSATFASAPTMCAMDIIYARKNLRSYLIAVIAIVWLYELTKFLILILFCVEQHLAKKRKGYGFRRRKTKMGQVAPASSASESAMETNHPDNDFDVEKAISRERKKERRSLAGYSLATQILQVRDFTEGKGQSLAATERDPDSSNINAPTENENV